MSENSRGAEQSSSKYVKTTLDRVYQGDELEKYMKLHRLIAMNEKGMAEEEANRLKPNQITIEYRIPRKILKPTDDPDLAMLYCDEEI